MLILSAKTPNRPFAPFRHQAVPCLATRVWGCDPHHVRIMSVARGGTGFRMAAVLKLGCSHPGIFSADNPRHLLGLAATTTLFSEVPSTADKHLPQHQLITSPTGLSLIVGGKLTDLPADGRGRTRPGASSASRRCGAGRTEALPMLAPRRCGPGEAGRGRVAAAVVGAATAPSRASLLPSVRTTGAFSNRCTNGTHPTGSNCSSRYAMRARSMRGTCWIVAPGSALPGGARCVQSTRLGRTASLDLS